MAGNASTVKTGFRDLSPSALLSAPHGDVINGVPTVTASGTAAGYTASDVLKWDRSRWKSDTGTSAHWLELDYSSTGVTDEYNYVFIWLQDNSTYDNFSNYGVDISIITSPTGAYAGEETTQYTVTAAMLAGGLGVSYGVVCNSRIIAFPMPSDISLSTNPYLRVNWAAGASNNVSFAKIGVYSMDDVTNVVANIKYSFNDRTVYNATERGGDTQYSRDFRRKVSYLTKYNANTVSIINKSGTLIQDWQQTPVMLMLDSGDAWHVGSSHLNTLPVVFQRSADYTIKPQYSNASMYSELPLVWDEHL